VDVGTKREDRIELPRAVGAEPLLVFSRDGRMIALVDIRSGARAVIPDTERDPTVTVWDLSTRTMVREIALPFSPRGLAFSPDGGKLAVRVGPTAVESNTACPCLRPDQRRNRSPLRHAGNAAGTR
jgi:hypothetical protein